jgi:hypothetical protein
LAVTFVTCSWNFVVGRLQPKSPTTKINHTPFVTFEDRQPIR